MWAARGRALRLNGEVHLSALRQTAGALASKTRFAGHGAFFIYCRQCQSVQFVRCSNMSEKLNHEKQLDRRISVAPMMDWTDSFKIGHYFNGLAISEIACLLYVSSRSHSLESRAVPEGRQGSLTRPASY